MYCSAKYIICLPVVLALMLVGCSSGKNTAASRWWQAFNTRYNVYYNGAQAYIAGSLEKETGNHDDFTEMIPLYTVGNKSSRELGKSYYEKAIEKAEKAIRLHSIKRRPQWNKNRRKTAADIEWLHRREYNPFLWKAWMLMGRAQFQEGNFDDAISTFSYMSRLYATQPAIYGRARAWLAKAYVENDMLYDAEDVIRNIRRDSIHWRAQKEWDYTYADYFIHTGDYTQAVVYLQRVIRHEMRRKQKAREYYLLGQLLAALGRNAEAARAYRRAIRLNPPYELAFNARIALSEVLSRSQGKKMIRKLRHMARSDNSKDYLDRIYYAIGNICLAENDTLQAIRQYELGNRKATRSGAERGVLLLRLGELYWQRRQWSDARRCYDAAIGMIDDQRKDYAQAARRARVLDKLTPYTEAVLLQDSLQALSRMSEKERNEAIDRAVEAFKKREKEQRDSIAEAGNRQNRQQDTGPGFLNPQQAVGVSTMPTQGSTWYFYNPAAVMQGRLQFQRTWGARANADNWQRSNKTVVALAGTTDENTSADRMEQALPQDEAPVPTAVEPVDDPHRREYYLRQIPFTEEQKAASDAVIMDALYHSGVIFKDELDDLDEAEKALRRLTDDYPSYDHMDEALYHLFLLYSRKGKPAVAAIYTEKLKQEWPDSRWTREITDPYFHENAVRGVHLEDSLYAATYDAFKAGRNDEVARNVQFSSLHFPQGANRDKFVFIGGLNALNEGDADACMAAMEQVVKDYPESPVAETAGMIVNGVRAGRTLHGGTFDISNIWQRRTVMISDSDSLQNRTFSNERATPFVFMLVYEPDSVDEHKLLFEMARYNFTSYLVRDFDLTVETAGMLRRMRVDGFQNYDEALQYARNLYRQAAVRKLAAKARAVIISDKNLPLLGSVFSYDDYNDYYERHFAPLAVAPFRLLTEPAAADKTLPEYPDDNPVAGSPDSRSSAVPTATEIDNYLQENYDLPDTPSERPAQPVTDTKKDDGLTIYFNESDDSAPASAKQPHKPSPAPPATPPDKEDSKKEPSSFDLEDEYYDLDGF